jgi:iron complex transport system substrate-binding protein
MKSRLCSLLACALLSACTSKQEHHRGNPAQDDHHLEIRYAEGFRVTYLEEGKLVEVTRPYPGSTSGYKYLLVERGRKIQTNISGAKIVYTPLSTIVCTSTTHIPLLDYLEETEALIGFPTTNYISSEKTRAWIDKGKVTELGIDKGMDLERIALLKPDLVMGYTMTGDFGQFQKIEELGVPVVINAEYLETHPLGRAEWIKFMALFFDKESLADSVFRAIELAYLQTRELISTVELQPTVMSGIVYGDTWFLPGGKNYAARFFEEAGCRYLWADNDSNGFLELSFESVYEKAHKADFWIGVASFKSLKEIEEADRRYTKFKAFQEGTVFTYDARKGATGGSEFLELGYLRPDLILKDLIKIAHPELIPDHEFYFHARLK